MKDEGAEEEFWVDEEAWGRALDPSLPPGVIALKGSDGKWWRYPLCEFDVEDSDRTWES
jgi:hypothetical protein